ncbi:hypothetical protein CCACVL1_23718 [Corchorus capsularis]|uniref:Uncharacterized protein n=1 Tax=Corchorus capsularis TaxID=210143 RepID=A0A1R3GSY5_COCAP|nr:hypothetical protein CCACVL1_23718 [Corchorus capsularis]
MHILDQVHELHVLVSKLKELEITIPDAIRIGAILSKMPHTWNDYRKKELHSKDILTIDEFMTHLQIESENRDRDATYLGLGGDSKVNFVTEQKQGFGKPRNSANSGKSGKFQNKMKAVQKRISRRLLISLIRHVSFVERKVILSIIGKLYEASSVFHFRMRKREEELRKEAQGIADFCSFSNLKDLPINKTGIMPWVAMPTNALFRKEKRNRVKQKWVFPDLLFVLSVVETLDGFQKLKGTQGLIESENPNLAKQKNLKARDDDIAKQLNSQGVKAKLWGTILVFQFLQKLVIFLHLLSCFGTDMESLGCKRQVPIGGLSELKALDESGKLDEKIDFLITEAPSVEAPLPPLSGEDDVSSNGPVDELSIHFGY